MALLGLLQGQASSNRRSDECIYLLYDEVFRKQHLLDSSCLRRFLSSWQTRLYSRSTEIPHCCKLFPKSSSPFFGWVNRNCLATGSSFLFLLSWCAIGPGNLRHHHSNTIPRSSLVFSATMQQSCYKPPRKSKNFLPCENSGLSSGESTSAPIHPQFLPWLSLLESTTLYPHIKMESS